MAGPLKNQRQEKFALGLIEGKTQSQAYADAGYKPDDGHASRLAGNGKIAERVAYLRKQSINGSLVTRERNLEHLAVMAYAELGDADVSVQAKLSALDKLNKMEGYNIERAVTIGVDRRTLTPEDVWASITERLELVRRADGAFGVDGGEDGGGE